MLTSIQNERVKLAHALQNQAKSRRRENKIALEGMRLIRDALTNGIVPDFILYDPTVVIPSDLTVDPVLLIPAATDVIRHISDTEQPQGIIGVFAMPTPAMPAPLTRALILDNIRDPGNMGTMLRTAAAAGVQAVLLSPGCVDPYNPKVLRAGMGAHFRLGVFECSWNEIETLCDELPVYLADMVGDTPYDQADWSRWALIIGSEAHGASPEAQQLSTHVVYIPMAERAESLNAAVAAGILLFEAYRHTH